MLWPLHFYLRRLDESCNKYQQSLEYKSLRRLFLVCQHHLGRLGGHLTHQLNLGIYSARLPARPTRSRPLPRLVETPKIVARLAEPRRVVV